MKSCIKGHRLNFIYLVGIVIIFATAIWLRAALPPLPLLNNDSWGYLQPAITSLAEGWSEPSHRGFFYPAILWCILKLFPDFFAIVVIQHGLGLLAGVVLIWAWEKMRIFLPLEAWIPYAHRFLGWVILEVYLFSNASIAYEHSILPESIFPFFAILCILVATEFSRRVFILGSSKGKNILVFLLVLLACTIYYLKPAWGLAAFAAMTPLFAAWTMRPSFTGILPPFLAFLIVLGFLEVPERLIHRTVEGNKDFLSEILLCSNGETFYKLLKKDAALPLPYDPRKKRAETLLPKIQSAMENSPRPIPFGYTLFNPDSLLYDGAMTVLKKTDVGNFSNICYEYYWRAWQEYPASMLWKIAVQFFYFYCPWKSVNYCQAEDFQVLRRLERSLQVLQDNPSYSWPPYQKYRQQVFNSLAQQPHFSLFPPLVTLATLLNPLYMPMTLLASLAAIWVLFSKKLIFDNLRHTATWCLYLLSYNFAMSLTIAIVHMMAVDRYHFVQTIFSILSQCFAVIFLGCFIQSFLKNRKKPAKGRFSLL